MPKPALYSNKLSCRRLKISREESNKWNKHDWERNEDYVLNSKLFFQKVDRSEYRLLKFRHSTNKVVRSNVDQLVGINLPKH